jgi:hypothetical protein
VMVRTCGRSPTALPHSARVDLVSGDADRPRTLWPHQLRRRHSPARAPRQSSQLPAAGAPRTPTTPPQRSKLPAAGAPRPPTTPPQRSHLPAAGATRTPTPPPQRRQTRHPRRGRPTPQPQRRTPAHTPARAASAAIRVACRVRMASRSSRGIAAIKSRVYSSRGSA